MLKAGGSRKDAKPQRNKALCAFAALREIVVFGVVKHSEFHSNCIAIGNSRLSHTQRRKRAASAPSMRR
jgi:hypothetical protein